MPVQNIECQIAQSQIGRYLHGDRFSPDALKQLEGHISECQVCTEILAARKKALQTLLSQATESASPQTDIDASTDAILNLIRSAPDDPKMTLIDVIRHKESPTVEAKVVVAPIEQASEEASHTEVQTSQVKAPNYPRIAVLTGLLAVVTLGMNYFAKDPSRLFGEKVGVANSVAQNASGEAPSLTTGGESAISVIESFSLEEIVPPLFSRSIFDYKDSVEARAETLRNSEGLPDDTNSLSQIDEVQDVSAPLNTPQETIPETPKVSTKKAKPVKKRTVAKIKPAARPASTTSTSIRIYPPEN